MFTPPAPRDAHSSGKFRSVSRRQVEVVERGAHGPWQFEISRRQLGLTVRREQFSVTIRWPHGAVAEHLEGFRSRDEARRGATERIEALALAQRQRQQRTRRLGGHSIPPLPGT